MDDEAAPPTHAQDSRELESTLDALRAASSQLLEVAAQTAHRMRSLEAILAIVITTVKSEPTLRLAERCAANLRQFSAELDIEARGEIDANLVEDILKLLFPPPPQPRFQIIHGGKS